MKAVKNACFGGFGLSDAAIKRYLELKQIVTYPEIEFNYTVYFMEPGTSRNRKYFDVTEIPRNDPALIQVVEELGDAAGSRYSKLVIVDLPYTDINCYEINCYDGRETFTMKGGEW